MKLRIVLNRQFLVCYRYCSQDVRVRFAPSPTGDLHLGSLRTALYNYLFAKHHKGTFILRIEDTDQTRLVKNSVNQIHRVLHHYGLKEDEGPSSGGCYGPYEQSKRLELYQQATNDLLDKGASYRCFCSEERLALLRKDAVSRNAIPKYDRKCMNLDRKTSDSRAKNEPFVIRFKMDKQEVSFKDEVFGDVTQTLDESDMVLLKSDGFPTYHLANVVDDRSMKISHVIRGMEWLSSTGKHVALYRAFDWTPPKWIHLSVITKDGKKKLSKRDKDAFVDYYEKDLGSLPIAVLNLLIRNGSGIGNYDNNKLYSLEEMVDNFDSSALLRRNLQLDLDSLSMFSRLAFQQASPEDMITVIRTMMPDLTFDDGYLRKVILFLQSNEEKFAYLSSLINGEFKWFLSSPSSTEQLLKKFEKDKAAELLREILEKNVLDVESAKLLASRQEIPYTKVLLILRLALIDSPSGPPIAELVNFFGVAECRNRIENMLSLLN